MHCLAWGQAMGSKPIISKTACMGICSDRRLPGQGREAEVVVFSTVRCNLKSSIGFVSDERRLNVAITRPRRCLPFPFPFPALLLSLASPTQTCACMEPPRASESCVFLVAGHEAVGTFSEVTPEQSTSGLSSRRTSYGISAPNSGSQRSCGQYSLESCGGQQQAPS